MDGGPERNRVGLILVVAIVVVSLACLCLAAAAGVVLLRSRPGPATPTARPQPSATAEERPGASMSPGAPSAEAGETPMVVCTPPLCGPGEVLECPGECPSGCGTVCKSQLPELGITPGALGGCAAEIDLLNLTLTYGPDHPLLRLALERCLQVLQETEADATGDGTAEQFVITAGAGCGSCEAQTLFVFVNRELTLEYEGALLAAEPHEDGTGFDLREAAYSSDDPMCCPSAMRLTPFRWTGAAFEPGEPRTEPGG